MKKGRTMSAAQKAHLSRLQKQIWAEKRSRADKARIRLAERVLNHEKPHVPVSEPVKRFMAFNYCPNCGTHLSRLYPYGHVSVGTLDR
jgi:hypothetical protein